MVCVAILSPDFRFVDGKGGLVILDWIRSCGIGSCNGYGNFRGFTYCLLPHVGLDLCHAEDWNGFITIGLFIEGE